MGKEELKYFKILAKDLLQIKEDEYIRQERLGKFFFIRD